MQLIAFTFCWVFGKIEYEHFDRLAHPARRVTPCPNTTKETQWLC